MERMGGSDSPREVKNGKGSKFTAVLVVQQRMQSLLQLLGPWSPHIEFWWYMTINLATCWMFLYRPFEWPQEAGKQQRFMW